jgi:protocatechuate 3,4-dioxygenase, beta subunit
MKTFNARNTIVAICVFMLASTLARPQNITNQETDIDCEDCEATQEYGSKKLHWIDTLPDFGESGKKMEISGTIYKQDGKTHAAGVILYIYHTDQTGNYTKKGNETGWGKRHGYIRGWVRTGPDGKYKFYTLKPAPYPGGGTPAHIHAIVKEEGRKEYVIDAFVFEGDPYLTPDDLNRPNPRGGAGIIKLRQQKNGLLLAHRNITLGLNVPGYK